MVLWLYGGIWERAVCGLHEVDRINKKGLYRITDYYIRFWFTMSGFSPRLQELAESRGDLILSE